MREIILAVISFLILLGLGIAVIRYLDVLIILRKSQGKRHYSPRRRRRAGKHTAQKDQKHDAKRDRS